MSFTGLISISYTCILDIPWHARGVMHLQAPSGSAQTMTLANLSLRLTMGPAEDAQSSEVPEPVPGKPESPPKTLPDAKVCQDLYIVYSQMQTQGVDAHSLLPSCPFSLQRQNYACCIG